MVAGVVSQAPQMQPALAQIIAFGGLGSVWFGAPILSACILASRKDCKSPWWCVAEFAIALVCGMICAAAAVPYIAEVAKQPSQAFSNALATGLGLAQKEIAPHVSKVLSQFVAAFSPKTPPSKGPNP